MLTNRRILRREIMANDCTKKRSNLTNNPEGGGGGAGATMDDWNFNLQRRQVTKRGRRRWFVSFFFMFLHHPNNRFEYISALILPLFNSRVPHPKIILRIKTIMEENFRPLQAPKLRL